jgi:hypothetical protein
MFVESIEIEIACQPVPELTATGILVEAVLSPFEKARKILRLLLPVLFTLKLVGWKR